MLYMAMHMCMYVCLCTRCSLLPLSMDLLWSHVTSVRDHGASETMVRQTLITRVDNRWAFEALPTPVLSMSSAESTESDFSSETPGHANFRCNLHNPV